MVINIFLSSGIFIFSSTINKIDPMPLTVTEKIFKEIMIFEHIFIDNVQTIVCNWDCQLVDQSL
jgi:hypothetical protein